MKVNVEISGLTIGLDNSITDCMKSGKWGVRLVFCNDNNDGRCEIVLKNEEIPSLILQLENALNEIKKVKDKYDNSNF